MALTRTTFDRVMTIRVGPLLTLVGLSGADLTQAYSLCIAEALGSIGLPVADPTVVIDAELVTIEGINQKQAIEIAVLSGLELVLSRWTKPNATAGTDNRQEQGTLRNSIEITVARMKRDLKIEFGYGLGEATVSTFHLNFAESDPEPGSEFLI